ncbi:sensor histidine kinase [uncultured Ruminococcus sp.]|uniref:sensor histidine kinase n=1 Tax=uncultured Ruminococcus sp. TaxID=165186 RepID=UPI0025D1D140|nr:sensor histidine kinase [uncultured Ruminococcus sp.]
MMTVISYLAMFANIAEQLLIMRLTKIVCGIKASRLKYLGYLVLIISILPAPILISKPDTFSKGIMQLLFICYCLGRIAAYSIILNGLSPKILYIFLLTMCPPQIYMNICQAFIDDAEICNLVSFLIDDVSLALILLHIRRRKLEMVVHQTAVSFPKKLYVNVLFLSLIAAVFVMGENKPNHELYYKIYILPCMIGLIVTALSIIQISVSEAEKNTTVDMLSKQVENEVKYYEKINTIYGEFKSFRHDFKNHIICLRSLIEADETENALKYIDEIEELSAMEKKPYNSGNIIIDALLSDKNERAASMNAKIVFSGHVPSAGISNVDLCIIMANAIDNAIDACGKDDADTPKTITAEASFQQGYFFFNITNPIFETVEIKGKHTIATSKEDKEHHGFGVINIIRTVKKYDGEARLSADDKQFRLELELVLKPDIQ